MNTKEFLERHPKPWHSGQGKWGEAEICDSKGLSIGLSGLLKYIEEIEGERQAYCLDLQRRILKDCEAQARPVEELFGQMPEVEALARCRRNCESKKIRFDRSGKAMCARCGRFRSYYDRKV